VATKLRRYGGKVYQDKKEKDGLGDRVKILYKDSRNSRAFIDERGEKGFSTRQIGPKGERG